MAFCSPRELVAASARGLAITTYTKQPNPYDRSRHFFQHSYVHGPITMERAREIVEAMKAATKERAQGKVNRPYELLPLTNDLDQDQPWIGWEIECGWNAKEGYDKVIDYLWRYQDHVTVDTEGCGRYASEITFAPENASKMWSGKSQAKRFLNWVVRKRDELSPATWRADSHVGTHCNISTPAYRNMAGEPRYSVVGVVNSYLHNLTGDQCRQLFGRSRPYGWAFANGSGRNAWIEFKLFNSTIDPVKFDGYVKVSKGLARLIDIAVARCSRPRQESPNTLALTLNNSPTLRAYVDTMNERRREMYGATMRDYVPGESIYPLNTYEFIRAVGDDDATVPLILTPVTNSNLTVEQKAALIEEAKAIFAARNEQNNS